MQKKKMKKKEFHSPKDEKKENIDQIYKYFFFFFSFSFFLRIMYLK